MRDYHVHVWNVRNRFDCDAMIYMTCCQAIYITETYVLFAVQTHIMSSSHRSKRNRTSLHVSATHVDIPSSNTQRGRSSRTLLHSHSRRAAHLELSSDPIEDASSDADSFGVDDMYGTDSGIESISMNAVRPQPTSNTDQLSVWILFLSSHTNSHSLNPGTRCHQYV